MKFKFIKGKFFRAIVTIWILFAVSILFGFFYFIALSNNFLGLFGEIPSFEQLENPRNEIASEIYTADNILMGKYYRQDRTPTTYEELSPYLINALIATEDERFENHAGIDLEALLRVLYTFGRAGGGSTLTQQLAKNLYRTRGKKSEGTLHKYPVLRTLVTKTKEWVTAVKIEKQYTKREIIEMYLNTVSFGHNAYGIHTAAKTFFDKHPSQLDIPESAIIVGLLKAPTRYSPISNKERSKIRRNVVMKQMVKYGYLTDAQYNYFKEQTIEIRYGKVEQISGIAPYLRVEAKKFLLQWAKENGRDLYKDGLRIYTTIDSRMQKYAEESVHEHMIQKQKRFYQVWSKQKPWVDGWNKELPDFIQKEARKTNRYYVLRHKYGLASINPKEEPQKYKKLKAQLEAEFKNQMYTRLPMRVYAYKKNQFVEIDTVMTPMDSIRYYRYFLHAGFMAMEPTTGQIKAWVGGTNFKHFQYDHVFQGKRQPGSTFKPILYTAALDNGYTPCYKLPDTQVCFGDGWCPRNANLSYSGAMLTLRRGLAWSVNSIAAGLIKQVGPKLVIAYARDLGITSYLDTTATLCLGTSDVSIYELLGAYCTFANKGDHIKPMYISRIEDRHGNLIYEFIPEVTKAISEELAYQMLYMLMGGTTVPGGTGMALHAPSYYVQNKASTSIAWHNEIGAKTGTTQNNSDAWFMGLTRNLAAGVWVGGETRATRFKSIVDGQGAVLALPVWGRFFKKVYGDPELLKKYPKGAFERPEELSIELNCAKMEAERQRLLSEE